jgi:acyl-CoA reductase-like NAD-dependent aldehyde dehydrogenase
MELKSWALTPNLLCRWVIPVGSSSAANGSSRVSDTVIDVIDSATEQLYFHVPEAQPADMDLAIGAARRAFDRARGHV